MSQIPFVTELGDALQAAISAEPAARPAPRRRRWRLPILGVFAPLVLTAAALAASGILFGSPYNAPWAKRAAHADVGVPIRGSVRLLSLRVADPAGGPPWGMRVLRTTRGYECVQVGRVLAGRLGVLGQDGWFGDDHRFHPLPPSAFEDFNCSIAGTGGYALIGAWDNLHASGIDVIGKCAYPGPQGSGTQLPVCPAGDLRLVAYGLLGPRAQAISYARGEARVSLATLGPEGAYLVVRGERGLTISHGSGAGGGGLAGGGGPGSFPGAQVIVYHDGHTCPAQISVPDTCPYTGLRLPVDRHLHVGAVRVRVSVRPAEKPFGAAYSEVVLHFRSPITIRSGTLDLFVSTVDPGVSSGLDSLDRDIRKGAEVAQGATVPNCTRRASVKLFLARTNPMAAPGMGTPTPLATLARLTIRLPRAPRPAWCR